MPSYRIDAQEYDIRRNAVLLDTSVLVSGFDPNDNEYDFVRSFLEDARHQLLVPLPVIVEAWGVLNSSRKRAYVGSIEMLRWICTPGKALIVEKRSRSINHEVAAMIDHRVDVVDAILAVLATDIANKCAFRSGMKVATYDTRDFYKFSSSQNWRLEILDLREESPTYAWYSSGG
jgi:predicted nucleic acid-binding protein